VTTKIGVIAERVSQAVGRLPKDLQRVIEVQYLSNSAITREQKAEQLGCSTKTFYKHIHRAHEQLSDDLPDSYASFGSSYPPVNKPSPLG
jgi:DNA-directed RNA polymerase specialized sigma24 family protein